MFVNSKRQAEYRVTYKVVSSSQHKEWLRSLFNQEADLDCIICIALCYGKVGATMHLRAEDDYALKGSYHGPNDTAEYVIQTVERYKYLLPIDMGLCLTDEAAHSPLLMHIRHRALKNLRQRTQEAAAYRRWEKQNRYEPLLREDDSEGEQ